MILPVLAQVTTQSGMALTLQDVGVLVTIGTLFVAGQWAVNQSQLRSLKTDLTKNFELDEKRENGIGKKIESLSTRFNDYRVEVSDNYVKKEEIKELTKEMKSLEAKLDSYNMENQNQYKHIMDILTKLVK
jgi:septal ring factor EnvC (AmiA/AmiB activator)